MAETFTQKELVVLSTLMSRAALAARMGATFNGQRNYYETFGYPSALTYDDYYDWYRRGGLAKRIIDLPCKATWRQPPEVLETEDPKTTTQFEQAWIDLDTRLALLAKLYRADVLQCIGCYSVLLLGTTDNEDFAQPLRQRQFRRPQDLLYVQPLSEIHAQISELEADPKNENFGKPKYYTVNLGQGVSTAVGGTTRSITVHASRLIHFAEGTLEQDILGTPKLEAVFNLLLDLLKVTGGGAETYWLNAANKIKIEEREGYKINEEDLPDLKDKLAAFVHNLDPWLILQGTTGDRMGVQVADPTGNYDVLMSQIAGVAEIPLRILTGSERGELASTQDRDNFADTITDRRTTFAEPGMLRPLVDRLLEIGILPEPRAGEYLIEWAHPIEVTDLEKADLALKQAQAAAAYVSGNAELIFTPEELRETMGMDPEKPESDIQDQIDEQDAQVQEQMAAQFGQQPPQQPMQEAA